MSDWIDINLPWNGHDNSAEYKKISKKRGIVVNNAVKRAGRALGYTEESLCIWLYEQFKAAGYKANTDLGFDSWSHVIDELNNKPDDCTEPAFLALKEYRQKINTFNDWISCQADVIEADNNFYAALEKDKLRYFSGTPLCRSGVLIETRTGDEIKEYLIGDINTNGGACNCYNDFTSETIVLRYKIVI